jgi:hypothetical protein
MSAGVHLVGKRREGTLFLGNEDIGGRAKFELHEPSFETLDGSLKYLPSCLTELDSVKIDCYRPAGTSLQQMWHD